MDSAQPALAGIFGNGRSGTTWLGAIADSHPAIAYRFEPFHRAAPANDPQGVLASMLREGHAPDLDRLYETLRPADPEWHKPPFFPKSFRTRLSSGRALLWPAARRLRPAGALFRFLYSPLDRPLLVFKEVGAEGCFRSLARAGRIPLVYLVRHPCGNVSSTMAGQELGLMGTGRRSILADYVARHAPHLVAEFDGRIDALSPPAREALLWRANVETSLAVLDETPEGGAKVLVVFYEELCRRPEEVSRRVLAHLGLDLHPQVTAFLAASTNPARQGRGRLREIGVGRYFSVFRDPRASMDAWRTRLDAGTQAEILDVVRGSPVFRRGIDAGHWSE